jgi:GNAT superfamily N-acetyltransferase
VSPVDRFSPPRTSSGEGAVPAGPAPAVEASPHEPPPGYPRDFERRLTLRDGRTVLVRPIVPADQEALGHAFRTADADTLRRRFLGCPPSPTPALLAHLCTVDYRRRFALVAADTATGQGVAVGRYETTAPGVAEVALAVDPAWRRVGLATAMVELLAEAALGRDIHSFDASYLAGNRPVAAIVDLVGGAAGALIRQGVAEVEVALDPAKVSEAVHRLETPRRPV